MVITCKAAALLSLACLLFLARSTTSSTFSLSFNLSNINPESTRGVIIVTGDASISNQTIQVTPEQIYSQSPDYKVGRATYVDPMYLWDKASGQLADFSSHFSFIIDSNGSPSYADGLTFFLAPVGSDIPMNSSGGNLGLQTYNDTNNTGRPNSPQATYVAVEFDTYENPNWDPPRFGIHVGIDVNSLASVAATPWHNNVTLGLQNQAWIRYNGGNKILSVEFTNGTQLATLTHVVDLRNELPERVVFGFSAATGTMFQRNIITSWDFSSTLQTKKKKNLGLIVALSVGLPILVVALAFVSYRLWKKPVAEEDLLDPHMDSEFERGRGPCEFSYDELFHATKKFAESQKLGQGGFGAVYHGWLMKTNREIAVKRVSKESKQGLNEYQAEVKIISQLKHRNLVQLVGWCHKKVGELLLVYEFMPNGSLDSHLFKGKSVLSWELRYKIAKGVASALLYLHEEAVRCVLHRDIKPSNVMLDSNFDAKLGDFGLARLVDHDRGSRTTDLAGTWGYIAPECATNMKASKESDVYSYGVMLLEIACGRRQICNNQEEKESLVDWVWSLYGEGRLCDAADPKLEGEFEQVEMERLLVIGLWCAHQDSTQRPSARKALIMLNFEADLPLLHMEMSKANLFFSDTMTTSSGGSTSRLIK